MDSELFQFSAQRRKRAAFCEVLNLDIRKNLVHEPSKGFDCFTPSRTMQQFKEECDVNNIIENYTHSGILPAGDGSQPVFGDFTKIPQSYGDMVAMIQESRDHFMELPSDVRRKFNDDPVELMKFIQDENNVDEARKLGLIAQPAEAKE